MSTEIKNTRCLGGPGLCNSGYQSGPSTYQSMAKEKLHHSMIQLIGKVQIKEYFSTGPFCS